MADSIVDIEQLLTAQKEWRKDPRICAYTLFVNYMTKQQEEILMSVFENRKTFAKSGHGYGKSFGSALAVLCFLYSFYPSEVITLAPSWAQVEKVLWKEISALWLGNKLRNELNLGGQLGRVHLKLDTKWRALGLSPRLDTNELATRLTGFHSPNQLVVLDEAPAIDIRIWEIVKTILTGENSKLLAIGNPIKAAGPFFQGFQDPMSKHISLNLFETPNFEANNIKDMAALHKIASMPTVEMEETLARMKNPVPALITVRWAIERYIEWGPGSPLFQSRVLANFPKISSDGLIDLYDLEMCGNTKNYKKSIRSMGVDPARIKDRCVLFGLEDFKECLRIVTPGHDLMKLRNEIIRVAVRDEYNVIAVEVGGLGIGLYDALAEARRENKLIPPLMPINFGASPTEQHSRDCANLVTELWLRLSKIISNHEILLEDKDTLFAELVNRKYDTDRHGKLIIEPKAKYKSRVGGQSPDIADALLCAVAGIALGTTTGTKIRAANRSTIGGGNLEMVLD